MVQSGVAVTVCCDQLSVLEKAGSVMKCTVMFMLVP